MYKIRIKLIHSFLCFCIVIGLVVPVYAADLSITYNGTTYLYDNKRLKVECNGTMILSDKTPGILENGNGLVPYNIFQYKDLGVKANYNKKTKKITFEYNKQKAIVTVGKDTMVCNGKSIMLPAKPRFVRYNQSKITKLLVPSRKIAETLGLDYEYNSAKAVISIKQNGKITENKENTTKKEENIAKNQIEIDGKIVTLTEPEVSIKTEGMLIKEKGFIIQDIAMLPAYQVFHKNKALGTTYKYDSKKKEGKITANGNTVVFKAGQKSVLLNGKKYNLINNIYMAKKGTKKKTYCVVPGREISRLLGFDYYWDKNNSTSVITKKPQQSNPDKLDKPSGGAIEKPSTGTTEKPSTGTTEKPSTGTTEKPSTGTTEKPSTGTTEKPSVGTTEKPSTGITEKPSTGTTEKPSTGITENINCEVSIKRPSSKVTWAMCDIVDDYHNRKWIITIQGDYKKFYEENPAFYNSLEVESVEVHNNSEGNTEIVIKTPTIKGISCYETKTSWELSVKSPKEIYDKIIVLDAGHGGKDSGAVSSFGVIEKESALKMVQAAKKYFDFDPSIKVYYTRLSDSQENITYGETVASTTTSVINRAKFANEIEADLFISIHCNSALNRAAKGTEILYSSQNTVVQQSGLTSKLFAETAFPILLEAVGSTKRSIKDMPNLIVCRNSEMPAILMEIAFVSNSEDAAILKDDACIDKIGKGIYDIVVATYDQYPKIK